jgi:pimeloyl-ACP methyl ester carboxylesterase
MAVSGATSQRAAGLRNGGPICGFIGSQTDLKGSRCPLSLSPAPCCRSSRSWSRGATFDVPVLVLTGEKDIVTLPRASETIARTLPRVGGAAAS